MALKTTWGKVLVLGGAAFMLCAVLAMREGSTGAGGGFLAFAVLFIMSAQMHEVQVKVRVLSQRLSFLEAQRIQPSAPEECSDLRMEADAATPSEGDASDDE